MGKCVSYYDVSLAGWIVYSGIKDLATEFGVEERHAAKERERNEKL